MTEQTARVDGRWLQVHMGDLDGALPDLTYRLFSDNPAYEGVKHPARVTVWVDGNDAMHAEVKGKGSKVAPVDFADPPVWLKVILDDAQMRFETVI